jgi:PAS domain S-box-containing protein
VWTDISSSLRRDKDGNPLYFMTTIVDITERKLAEKALKEAELKFRTIFNFASDGILLVRPSDRKFITTNKTMCEMLRYTEVELLRLGIPDIHEKQSMPHIIDQFEKLVRKEIVVAQNIPVMRKDKTVFFADVGASLITLDGKECVIGFFRDITERKKVEEILRESERQLREAQEMAHLGFWNMDVKTGDVAWSEEVFKIFCLDPKEFTPHIDSILALSPWPEDHQRDKEIINRAIENHDQGSYEQKFLRPDGSIGYYYSTFQGKYDGNGDLVSIVGTVLDITERRKAEEELNKLNTELEQRVTERTAELTAKTTELERINKVFVDRELRMRELKGRIAELERKT